MSEIIYDELYNAIENDDETLFEEALRDGADIDKKYPYGDTALTLALLHNRLNMALDLIDLGADTNICDGTGWTPLMYSAAWHFEVMSDLLDAGADVNAQDNEGKTALILAVEHNIYEAVFKLIKAGADVNIRDNNGKTSLDIVLSKGPMVSKKIVDLLEKQTREQAERRCGGLDLDFM